MVTRAFHHEGPRCKEERIGVRIVKDVLNASKTGVKKLTYGNVDAIRDFSDVRDIVNGYILAVDKGKRGDVYNLCTKKGYSIREIFEIVVRLVGMKKKISIVSEKKLFRVGDIPILIGDYSKAEKELGWKPTISLEESFRLMVEWWKEYPDLLSK